MVLSEPGRISMPLLKGAMGATRYRVVDPPVDLQRDDLIDLLNENGFCEPFSKATAGETLGWVNIHNLCVSAFDPEDSCYTQYLCFSLRIDNKRLPAKLVKARLELRAQEWMSERGADRIPAAVKRELKEQLELELLPKQLPSVIAHDVCWDLKDHKVWFFSGSRKANESFRLRFGQTFNLDLAPVGVMGALSGHPMADTWRYRLDAVGHSDYRPEQRL